MNITELLSANYGLEDVVITRNSVGLIDENYTVRSHSGIYFFKRFRSISAQEFKALERTLIMLKTHGIPCPEVVSPINTRPESMQHVMLFNYVTGEPFTGTLLQLKSIATLQQRIIELGLPAKILADDHVLHDLVAKTNETLQSLIGSYPFTDDHHTVWRYFVKILKEITPVMHEFSAPIYLVAMHPDFTERNMLFDETGTINLICDWQGYGPRILPFELADFFVRFSLNQPFEGVLNHERLQFLINTLTENNSFLDETIDHYRDHFSTLMILKQIASFSFRIGCYYAGNQPDLMAQIIDWSFKFVQWLAQTQDGSSLSNFLQKQR